MGCVASYSYAFHDSVEWALLHIAKPPCPIRSEFTRHTICLLWLPSLLQKIQSIIVWYTLLAMHTINHYFCRLVTGATTSELHDRVTELFLEHFKRYITAPFLEENESMYIAFQHALEARCMMTYLLSRTWNDEEMTRYRHTRDRMITIAPHIEYWEHCTDARWANDLNPIVMASLNRDSDLEQDRQITFEEIPENWRKSHEPTELGFAQMYQETVFGISWGEEQEEVAETISQNFRSGIRWKKIVQMPTQVFK